MAIIPSSTRFVGIAPSVNLTEKKSNQLNSETQPYTMQDIIDTASSPPAGTAGQIQFSDGSAFAADSNLFWDNTNKRLGVGTSTPTARLHVQRVQSTDGIYLQTGTTGVFLQSDNGGGSSLWVKQSGVGIGSAGGLTATAQLHIKGSGSTSATTSLLVQDSSGTQTFSVKDSGATTIYNGLTVQNAGINASSGLIQTTGAIRATGNNSRIGNIEILTSGNAGNTGIGISTPSQLEFQGYGDNYFSGGIASQFLFRHYLNGQVGPLVPATNHGLITLANTGWNNSGSNGSNFRLNALWLEPVINMNNVSLTGNIVRGIYYNPILTSLTNTTHYGIQTTSGGVYINTATPDASAALQADSTTQGFLPPRMTTAEKTAIATPAAGLMVYDNTLNQMSYYNGSAWVNF